MTTDIIKAREHRALTGSVITNVSFARVIAELIRVESQLKSKIQVSEVLCKTRHLVLPDKLILMQIK